MTGLADWLRPYVLGLAGAAIMAAAWALVAAAELLDGVPPPGDVLSALGEQLTGPQLWQATGHTLAMTAAATSIAAVAGVLVGAAIGMSPRVDALLGTTINTLRFVPPVALIPVMLLIMGFGSGSEIAIAAFAALWPVLLNVAAAGRMIKSRFEDMIRINRLGPLRKLVAVYVPGTVAATITGLRLAAALALILVVAIEMLAIPAGLGNEVRFAGDALQVPTMYAYIVWTGCVGLALNAALQAAERLLCRP